MDSSELATKSDLAPTTAELRAEIAAFREELRELLQAELNRFRLWILATSALCVVLSFAGARLGLIG